MIRTQTLRSLLESQQYVHSFRSIIADLEMVLEPWGFILEPQMGTYTAEALEVDS